MAESKTIYERLALIQEKIAVAKDRTNEFGKYAYRNAEDILKAAKPLAAEQKCAVAMSEKLVEMNGEVYIESTATLIGYDLQDNATVSAVAYAREAKQRSGMDVSQITGSATSYARKYALGGLFAIDDGVDADSMDNRQKDNYKQYADKTKLRAKQGADLAKQKLNFNVIKARLEKIDSNEDLENYWRSLGKLSAKQATFLQKLFAKRREQINGMD